MFFDNVIFKTEPFLFDLKVLLDSLKWLVLKWIFGKKF